ncbi:hypothetical protein Sjap_018105 [Stephania japonica]|uniref:Trichome birefringence-like N-terminal domain-containing protein n=1 Tax=Stephania japonica TaxID=461633 RepID=A0AAP0I7E7_9MAGN
MGLSGMAALPRTLAAIAISVGGLALFLVFGSWLLISHPIGSTLHGYFLGIDRSAKSKLGPSLLGFENSTRIVLPSNVTNVSVGSVASNFGNGGEGFGDSLNFTSKVRRFSPSPPSENSSKVYSDEVDPVEAALPSMVMPKNSSVDDSEIFASYEVGELRAQQGGCDLYQGSWFYDSSGPLYTNNTCPSITQTQNCQGNGRPDKDYENWRWKPSRCDLPRFDAKKFFELMRGKTLAFIGDSVARNQMESMLCILWQLKGPPNRRMNPIPISPCNSKNRGNRRMQRWFFKSASVTIVRIWSSWLVHKTSEPFSFAPAGVVKLHLDLPDEDFMGFLPSFDVVVISSGHWFAKESVYVLNNEIVGGQLWWPDKTRPKKIDSIEAFGISVETILAAMATHPNYTGLTIVRSYSPDHYEGGAWNTGGSCTGKVKPALLEREMVENGFTNIMHEKQVMGFNRAVKKATNRSRLKLMDITKAFGYRHDGHPGPYRSLDPNKKTKRGPNGQPPPQDCLHWCMPGPVDTWNELVLEIMRREFEGNKNSE